MLHSFSMLVGHQPSAPMTLAALFSGHPALLVMLWNLRLKAEGCLAGAGAGPALPAWKWSVLALKVELGVGRCEGV